MGIVAGLSMALIAACGGGGEPAAACVTPPPVQDTSDLPTGLPLAEFGTVTDAGRDGTNRYGEIITETTIVELYPPMARALLDAGYQILSSENEGFEAEIFFAKGRKVTGAYRLREGPCGDLVTVRLLYTTR